MRGRGKSRDSRYIPNVLSLIREHRSFFLGAILAALALRLFFFVYFPAVTDDSRVYANLAANWLQHGVYGLTQAIPQETQLVPTDARLPGYPMFLAAIFWLFGIGNFKAVLLTQILVDVGTGAPARPGRAQLGTCSWPQQGSIRCSRCRDCRCVRPGAACSLDDS